jgi:hypothetical protein
MTSSGHYIGAIIDDLSTIAYQVETRSKIGLYDLNKLLEDFFKSVLNELLGVSLVNLNQDRLKTPALDLGDSIAGVAFQVTSRNGATKINETLEKLTEDQLETYTKIRVLIIGHKKPTYTLKDEFAKRARFSVADIWDITDLCKHALDVPLLKLQELHKYIRGEQARIAIELELPGPDGTYPTSFSDYIEIAPTPQTSNYSAYLEFQKVANEGYGLELPQVAADFEELITKLKRLPRITRDCYANLLQHRDSAGESSFHHSHGIAVERWKRICHYLDWEGELSLLEAEGLAYIDQADQGDRVIAVIRIRVCGKSDYFYHDLVAYLDAKDIPYTKPLVTLDFRNF